MDNDNGIAHGHMNLEDKLTIVGELEHAYRHCLKSAAVVGAEEAFWYMVQATRIQQARRKLQATLGDIATEDWCLVKVGASIKQLAMETFEGDYDTMKELVSIADELMGHGVHVDLSDCKSCQDDKGVLE